MEVIIYIYMRTRSIYPFLFLVQGIWDWPCFDKEVLQIMFLFLSGRPLPATTETGRVQITEGDGRAIWWSCKTGLFTRLLQVKHIQVHQTYANIGYSIRYWRFVAAGLGKVSLFRFTSSPGFSTELMNVLSWGFRTVQGFFSQTLT